MLFIFCLILFDCGLIIRDKQNPLKVLIIVITDLTYKFVFLSQISEKIIISLSDFHYCIYIRDDSNNNCNTNLDG